MDTEDNAMFRKKTSKFQKSREMSAEVVKSFANGNAHIVWAQNVYQDGDAFLAVFEGDLEGDEMLTFVAQMVYSENHYQQDVLQLETAYAVWRAQGFLDLYTGKLRKWADAQLVAA
jgi:hypothetical protein